MKISAPETGAAVFEPATGMAERSTTSAEPAPNPASPDSRTSHFDGR